MNTLEVFYNTSYIRHLLNLNKEKLLNPISGYKKLHDLLLSGITYSQEVIKVLQNQAFLFLCQIHHHCLRVQSLVKSAIALLTGEAFVDSFRFVDDFAGFLSILQVGD